MTRDGDLRRTDSNGGFNVTAIGDMLGTKVDRHGHPWYKHVDHVTNHTANNKRINRGSHGNEKGLGSQVNVMMEKKWDWLEFI